MVNKHLLHRNNDHLIHVIMTGGFEENALVSPTMAQDLRPPPSYPGTNRMNFPRPPGW